MAPEQPIFTRDEVKFFVFELRAKFRDGLRSPDSLLYVVFTLVGIGWATWAIPAFNRAHTSPETVGVYAIGFLVTVFLDAMFTWKKRGEENKYEQAIAVLCMCLAFVLIILASYFSVHVTSQDTGQEWKPGAYFVLWVAFGLAVLMTLVLSGFEVGPPPVGPLDLPVGAVEGRNG